MQGGPFHEFMVDQLDAVAVKQGFLTKRNAPSSKGRDTGFIDLLIYSNAAKGVLLVEVEMTKKRALNDVKKRSDLGLGKNAKLWIVTPTFKLAQVIEQDLRRFGIDENEPISVLAFGAAMQQLLVLKGIEFSVDTGQKT